MIKEVNKKTTVTHVVNEETGEAKTFVENTSTKLYVDKDEFYLTYAHFMDYLKNPENKESPRVRLFAYLVKKYANGNDFSLSKSMRTSMAKELDMADKTISNNLTKLVNKELLIRLGTNHYEINAKYIFKGSSKERNKKVIIQLNLEE